MAATSTSCKRTRLIGRTASPAFGKNRLQIEQTLESRMARANRADPPEHEDVLVPFNMLHFDPINPRGEAEADEEKIRALFGTQDETIVLATHIAEHGQNPLDRIGIIAHPKLPGHFVIREGNRRLCAMQLLRDPQRAPTSEAQKTFQRLAKDSRPIPEQIQAVLFNQKPKARVWMSVKHEGPQGGLGTLTWGTQQKTRFNREGETGITRPKNPNRQAEALLTYALSHGLLTLDEHASLSITTINRFLPNVRTALALTNTEDCSTNADLAEFQAAVQRFLRDAIDPGKPGERAKVNSRAQAAERKAYAELLRSQGVAPLSRENAPYDPAQLPAGRSHVKSRKPRSATNPALRKVLIPSGFVVTHKSPVLRRMVIEGKDLDPEKQRFSANYLNRAILESVVRLYAKKFGVGAHGDFSPILIRVLEHAKATSSPPSKSVVTILAKAADKSSSYSYETLGSGVHGGLIPSGADNKSNWETLQPALEYLLELQK